jgi:hypothetical protein
MEFRELSYCLRGIRASLVTLMSGRRNDHYWHNFEMATIDSNSTPFSCGATVASSTSPGCVVNLYIVSIIVAILSDQRDVVMYRFNLAIAFRSAMKMVLAEIWLL